MRTKYIIVTELSNRLFQLCKELSGNIGYDF